MTSKDTIMQLAMRNGMYITEMVKVKQEDAEDANTIKHMCRGGFNLLTRQHVETIIPVQKANGMAQKPLIFDIWNCNHCGKTYYHHYSNETVSIF